MVDKKSHDTKTIKFTPSANQLYEMFRRGWKSIYFSSVAASSPGKHQITIVYKHHRLVGDDYQSDINFIFDSELDKVEVCTNVDYLDIYGEEIDDQTRIPNDRAEETEVTFYLKGKGQIHLHKVRRCEGFQVSID